MSTHEQWGLIKDLFETARSLPEPERLAYVDAHTSGPLRAELLSLLLTYSSLESDPESHQFLETPVDLPSAELLPGEWVGQRFGPYQASRLLAEGGMGSVYEGRRADGVFEQRVAIKIMKPELVSPHLLERFRQERQILASLDHPHIARLLDGGEKEASPWPVPYMVMEFIDGTPITRYTSGNRLDGKQCAALAADVCDAVGYAHDRQVIHRDIKPGNVMVDRQGHVKLLDFGISKIVLAGSGEADHTATVLRLATPAYASPEQLRGEGATAASDVFSLGALLYEMVSGNRLPREAWKPLAPPALDRIARKACAARAEDRYPSAAELGADLRRYIAGRRILAPRPPRRRAKILAAAALCAVAVVAAGWWKLQPKTGGKPSVAVLQLRNLSGRPGTAWISTAAAEILSAELGAGGAVHVVPEELTVRAARDLSLEPADSYSRDTLRKLHAYLNADRIVTGSFLSLSDQPADPLRFQFRMQDTRSGAIETPLAESASISELSAMATRASGRFRQVLGVVSPAGKGLPEAKPDALRYYADGLNFQRNFDFPKARVAFEQAVALDPSYSMAHFRLSEVFRNLGNIPQSDAEIELARQTSPGIRPEERLMIEGYALLRGPAKQRPESVARFQALLQLEPSSVEYGLLLGNAQMLTSDSQGALATLRDLRARQQPPDVGRIDLFEANMAYRRGEFQSAARLALHCADVVRPSGSRLLAAECLLKAGSADQGNGDIGRAMTELQQAEEIFSASGSRNRVADVRNMRAGVFIQQGKSRAALQEFEGVVEIARDIGNQALESAALSNVGLAHAGLGQFREAADAHLRAIEIMKNVRDTQSLSYAYVNLASAYMGLGDLKAADQAANQGLVYARELGGALEANAQLTLSDIRAWEGHLADAKQICGQALRMFDKIGAKRYAAYAHSMLGEMALDTGDDDTAGAEYTTALALARETHEDDLMPVLLIDQARLELAQGRYLEAAQAARTALGTVSPTNVDGKDLLWRTYLAVALAAQGQRSQADEQRQIVAKGLASLFRTDVRIQLLTAEGWLLIGEKKFAAAIDVLEEARKQAAAQMPSARGEAELAIAEADFGLGKSSEGISLLNILAAREPQMRAGKLARVRLQHPGPSLAWKPLP